MWPQSIAGPTQRQAASRFVACRRCANGAVRPGMWQQADESGEMGVLGEGLPPDLY
jgi:hypothetical protein